MKLTKALMGKQARVRWRDQRSMSVSSGHSDRHDIARGRKTLATWEEWGVVDSIEEGVLHLLQGIASDPPHETNRKDELTFADACAFWGIGDRDVGQRVDARLSLVETALRLAERAVEQGELTLGDGRVVAEEEVEAVRRVDDYLRVRFTRHLGLARARKQELIA